MLLIYPNPELKVPLMEQGPWGSPDVRFLANHLEGLPLIALYMSVGVYACVPPKHVCLMMTTL